MIKHLFILLLCLLSCGREKNTEPSSSVIISDQLKIRSEFYQSQLNRHQDRDGFIITNKCDSLLFSGLLSAVVPVNIPAARDAEGRWHRRPDHACGPEFDNSRSTISKDMVIGLLYYFWYNKDLIAAQQFMDDLKDNAYILRGEGTPGELFVPPAMVQTLAEIIKALGGPAYKAELSFPVVFSSEGGFVAHLNTWHILLRGKILSGVSDKELGLLKYHAERQPQNPLFQAAYHKYLDHNYADSVKLLLDEMQYPADRLPNTANHCDDWPVQRDYSEGDWKGCLLEVPTEHTGAELILIYRLIILT